MSDTTALIVGGAAVDAGVGPTVVDLARRTRTGVLNTWRAKGLFRFDDPAHLGTIGLQRDDLVLAGVAGERRAVDRVVVCGVADGELPSGLAGGLPADVETIAPDQLGSLELERSEAWPQRPPLYDALAAVCGPAYGADDVPLSPIRAVGDLAAWLPEGAVVVAGAGEPGFWLGRAFPTRAPRTVLLPPRPDPSFGTSATRTTGGGVVVVCGPDDEPPVVDRAGSVGSVAAEWVVVERWHPDGPALTPSVRLERLGAAVAAGGGEVEVAVALGDLGAVEGVAGPVVVWGGPAAGWRG